MLEFQNITKVYPVRNRQVHALNDISFNLDKGEFLIIRGPSGCGKTTLLLIAGCLLRPTEGKIIVNGLDPNSMITTEVNQLRARFFGFVFQQFHLIPYLGTAGLT